MVGAAGLHAAVMAQWQRSLTLFSHLSRPLFTAILNDDYSLKRTLKVKHVTPDGVVRTSRIGGRSSLLPSLPSLSLLPSCFMVFPRISCMTSARVHAVNE